MASSNVSRIHDYLKVVGDMGEFETVADFFSPDVILQEFPNRVAPQGRVRRAADLRAAYEQGRKILRSQTYDVQRILEAGDEAAVELIWTGILAKPEMNLPAGTEMKAIIAMFITFRDGKIISQRNYDCYPPFDAPPDPAIPA
jgi:ketosteroid isomerase-like protein